MSGNDEEYELAIQATGVLEELEDWEEANYRGAFSAGWYARASLAPEPAGDERVKVAGIVQGVIQHTHKDYDEHYGEVEGEAIADALLAFGFRSRPAPAATVEEVSKLCLSFLMPPKFSGGSWTLNPDALATALTAQFDMRRRDT